MLRMRSTARAVCLLPTLCFTLGTLWPFGTPAAAADPPPRSPRSQGPRVVAHTAAPWPAESDLLSIVGDALAAVAAQASSAESCQDECVGCVGNAIGLLGATAAVGATCGGAVFTGGLALAGCWISIGTAHGLMLATAANCARCDRCLNHPDPDAPPGRGAKRKSRCEPCDPSDPLINCPGPEVDPCADGDDDTDDEPPQPEP